MKWVILLLAIVCSVFGGQQSITEKYANNLWEKENQIVTKAFEASGSFPVSITVNGWTVIDNEYISLEEIIVIGEKAIEYFELERKNEFISNENKDIRQISIQGIDKKGYNINIIISNEKKANITGYETYHSITIVDEDNHAAIDELTNKVEGYFHIYNKAPKLSKVFQGYYEGHIPEYDFEKVIEKIFKETSANEVEGIRAQGLYSVCGYSKKINDYILGGNGRININAAIRYNEYEDKTWLWLGTPIINQEY